MIDSPLAAEISAFLEKYAAAFASFDSKAIASFYHVPVITLRGDGSIHCLASADEVENFFQTVADSYAREGSGGKATRSNLRVIPLGGRSALAMMDWEMLRADGSAIRGWQQSYNLVRGQAGWQILVSTFHVAAEQRAA